MHKLLIYVGLLAAGGVATSFAEYFFKYNLVDLVKDKILGLFGKAKAQVKDAAVDVASKL